MTGPLAANARIRREFARRPGEWIDARELAAIGGLAWRTRVSNVRRAFTDAGVGRIRNAVERGRDDKGHMRVLSAYRFEPAGTSW